MARLGAITPGLPDLKDLSHTVIKDECFFVATTDTYAGGVRANAGGTGAAISDYGTVAGHPGVIQLSAGTTSTGRCAVSAAPVALGSCVVRFGAIVKLPTLSNGTVTYTARMGFGDGASGVDFVDALGFRYTDGVNSGKWEAVGLSNSVETAVDTGIVADTNWHLYELVVNAAGNSADFLIDHVFVANVAAHIPIAAARSTGAVPALIRKSVDATAATRVLLLDMYYYIFETADLRPA